MDKADKQTLSESDVCDLFITPALGRAGWDQLRQVRREVTLTPGPVIVRGNLSSRNKKKRKFADYVLSWQPGLPVAIVVAKDNKHSISDGLQQALGYAEILDLPSAFSSNGDRFAQHNRAAIDGEDTETALALDAFLPPQELYHRYCRFHGITPEQEPLVEQPYHADGSGKEPRYYQIDAINRTIEAIAKDDRRVLLVMATGTGKTYTTFQIIWRLWKAGQAKRVLFLADRNILVDQTLVNDFKPFGQHMTKVRNRKIDPAYEIHLGLYQALTGPDQTDKIFKSVSRDFFDLIVVDECHRGSAAEDSAWREILDYFEGAIQIGLTATPKETEYVSNITYFGEPVYTYSLKQGIEDGFLAPYKVIRIDIDKDLLGRSTRWKSSVFAMRWRGRVMAPFPRSWDSYCSPGLVFRKSSGLNGRTWISNAARCSSDVEERKVEAHSVVASGHRPDRANPPQEGGTLPVPQPHGFERAPDVHQALVANCTGGGAARGPPHPRSASRGGVSDGVGRGGFVRRGEGSGSCKSRQHAPVLAFGAGYAACGCGDGRQASSGVLGYSGRRSAWRLRPVRKNLRAKPVAPGIARHGTASRCEDLTRSRAKMRRRFVSRQFGSRIRSGELDLVRQNPPGPPLRGPGVGCRRYFFLRFCRRLTYAQTIDLGLRRDLLRGYLSAFLILLLASPASADSIGAVRAKPPEFTAKVPLALFDVERCVIDTDNIGKPWVYRQPDRPEDVMLVWESSDLGSATVLEMHGLQNVEMKFWGRNKVWRKVQPCIGRSESDVK